MIADVSGNLGSTCRTKHSYRRRTFVYRTLASVVLLKIGIYINRTTKHDFQTIAERFDALLPGHRDPAACPGDTLSADLGPLHRALSAPNVPRTNIGSLYTKEFGPRQNL